MRAIPADPYKSARKWTHPYNSIQISPLILNYTRGRTKGRVSHSRHDFTALASTTGREGFFRRPLTHRFGIKDARVFGKYFIHGKIRLRSETVGKIGCRGVE